MSKVIQGQGQILGHPILKWESWGDCAVAKVFTYFISTEVTTDVRMCPTVDSVSHVYHNFGTLFPVDVTCNHISMMFGYNVVHYK